MDKNYKYIHIMYAHDDKFIGPLIREFNENPDKYMLDDNLFITPFPYVYEKLSAYSNVLLDESKCNLYRKYHKRCTLIISHGMANFFQVLTTGKKIKSKILYRYWGGSRTSHFKFEKPISLKVIYKYVKFRLFKHALESFAAIGITNTVDEIDLGRVSSELKYYYLPYASRYEWLSKIYEAYRLKPEKKEKINVLLGHRGKSEGNHIELLKKLMQYNTYINIYIPLSYGNKDYISEVKKYVSQLNDPCITVISDFMKPEDYARLLCKMDIGIFDGVTSYALGNISMMLEFHKTIYLKENGVIAQAFRKENIPYKNIENIGRVDVDEFIACFPEGDFDDRNMKLMPVSKNSMEERWSRVFEDFK